MMTSENYGIEFYNHESKTANESALPLLKAFFNALGSTPNSLIDIGCGVGAFLKAAEHLGVKEIQGLDGDYVPQNQLLIAQEKFQSVDLTLDLTLKDFKKKYDVAICLEVAEHIPSQYSEIFVKNLTKCSDLILFSAAIPGQPGTNHINCQWPNYWNHLFKKFNYTMIDNIRRTIWDNEKISYWYAQNVFSVCKHEKINYYFNHLNINELPPQSLVHPMLYQDYMRELINRKKSKLGKLQSWIWKVIP
jgi:cyclopropane fatty-acyl-phospholipid synthase-like methyltransferase